MAGLVAFLFALHLAAALLAKTPTEDGDRQVIMIAFVLLVSMLVTQPWPPAILPLLSLFFAAYLYKAR